ncbi:hypothetical protein ACOSP7_027400 [Xanthoceras sorbifolium]
MSSLQGNNYSSRKYPDRDRLLNSTPPTSNQQFCKYPDLFNECGQRKEKKPQNSRQNIEFNRDFSQESDGKINAKSDFFFFFLFFSSAPTLCFSLYLFLVVLEISWKKRKEKKLKMNIKTSGQLNGVCSRELKTIHIYQLYI